MKERTTKIKTGDTPRKGKTDWDRLDAMTDEDIDYSGIPEIDDKFFKDAKVVMPPGKKQISLRLDEDILSWMQSQGRGYQSRINSILRAYYEAHRG